MELDAMAKACAGLNAAWVEVGAGLAAVPSPASSAGSDAIQFVESKPGGPTNIAFAPGQYAGLYVDGIGQHLLALETLVSAGRVTIAPWPLIRAELELAGRVAWLLEPDLGEQSGERRVARFYMELISSHQRERFTAGKLSRSREKEAKKARDAKLEEARSVFGSLELDFSSIDKIESWVISDESFKGLGEGARLFVQLCFLKSSGLYDFLSDYSHPSLTAFARQTSEIVSDGVTTRPWVVELDTVEHEVRLACLVFYKACQILAGYFNIEASALDRWAESVPPKWFNDELAS